MPNNNKNIIDNVDHRILEILQNTGRDSASHIANEIGMSVPAVSERIHKLEQNGIISGYEAIVDPKKVGLDVAALITLVSESSHHFEEVVKMGIKNIYLSKYAKVTNKISEKCSLIKIVKVQEIIQQLIK